jgi:predicted anti-sigma-YlaC factor YlaD
MTCNACRAALSAVLDGEPPGVPVGERTRVGEGGLAEHLRGCADCRRWLAAAVRLKALAREAPGPDARWSEQLIARLTGSAASPGSAEGSRTATR